LFTRAKAVAFSAAALLARRAHAPPCAAQAQAEVRALRSGKRPADAPSGAGAGGSSAAAQQAQQQHFSALVPPPNPTVVPPPPPPPPPLQQQQQAQQQAQAQAQAVQAQAQQAQEAALPPDPERDKFERTLTDFLQSPAGAAAVAATGGTRNCARPRALRAALRAQALTPPPRACAACAAQGATRRCATRA
jgi:hypothetical protein